ncbi:MAG: hypothetical protein AAFR14_01830 [Bacteroidota bacterium]
MKIAIYHGFIIWILGSILPALSTAQVAHLDHNPLIYTFIDRVKTQYPQLPLTTSIRYQSPELLLELSSRIDSLLTNEKSSFELEHILSGYSEYVEFPSDKRAGLWNTFYRHPATFWQVNEPGFFLKVDPLLLVAYGNASGQSETQFQNTRGVLIRGRIDQKLYFSTRILETQRSYLPHMEREINRINAIPGQGFYKPFQSRILENLQGFDHLNAQSQIGLQLSPSIDGQFGYGRNFIGEGIRSMLLSDYGHNYLYLKFTTQVWKFTYQNLFASLDALSHRDNIGDQLLPKKYMAAHYLDLQISDRVSIGLYEAVIFGRDNGFELRYLNPLILYRSIEQQLDSPDNVLIGLNGKWIITPGLQLYGQLLIDEFRTSELFSGQGWWANKIGYQSGFKWYDVAAISGLDLQVEYNTARPFTYGHRTQNTEELRPVASYSHHNQALAHPYGANFSEWLISVRYRVTNRLRLHISYLRGKRGFDPDDSNLGSDILTDYNSRVEDFGHFTGQGNVSEITSWRLNASYMFAPNYFAEFEWQHRTDSMADDFSYHGIGIRANIWIEDRDF